MSGRYIYIAKYSLFMLMGEADYPLILQKWVGLYINICSDKLPIRILMRMNVR